jgi:hypothetical protein
MRFVEALLLKLTSSAFFVLLVCAHQAGDGDKLLRQPLSMFRDGELAGVGYALFGLLLLFALLYTAALVRSGREAEATFSCLAVVLFLMVALTPSEDSFHLLCSAVLLLLLFAYYALLLLQMETLWLVVLHLTVPVALAVATSFHSYGLWQKGIIAYFVIAAVLHGHGLVRRPERHQARALGTRGSRFGQPARRRKVYRLESGREWARHTLVRDSA